MPDTSAITKFDLSNTQVLFCDLQKTIVAHSRTTSQESLSSAVGALQKLARLFGLPAIISVVPEGKELIDELSRDHAPSLPRVTASLFDDPATERAIAQSGRRVLIVSGFMIEAVVLTTVLDALAKGYEVFVPVDACGSLSSRTENAAFREMEAAGAVTTSVVAIATRLEPDFSTERGRAMFEIVSNIHFD